MQIALFPYTSSVVAGSRGQRQDERARWDARPGAPEASSAAPSVDLVAAVGSGTAPLSVLVEAAALFPPAGMAGEAPAAGDAATQTKPPVLPGYGPSGDPASGPQAEPLTPLGSGTDAPPQTESEPLVLPGAGDRAREPISVALPGSRPASPTPWAAAGPDAAPPTAPGSSAAAGAVAPTGAGATQAPYGAAPVETGARSAEVTRPAEPQVPGRQDSPEPAAAEADSESGVAEELTEAEQREVEELKQRDREVRQHEQAHVAAGGQYVRGGASFEYATGPDNKRYAVGGEVSIDTSPVPDNPEATIRKAQVVYRAALAPAEPSAADRSVATAAKQMEGEARRDLAEERREETTEAIEEAQGASEAARSEAGEAEATQAGAAQTGAGQTGAGQAGATRSGAGHAEGAGGAGVAQTGIGTPPVSAADEGAGVSDNAAGPSVGAAPRAGAGSAAAVEGALPDASIAAMQPARLEPAGPSLAPAGSPAADAAGSAPQIEVDIDVSPRYSTGRLLDVMA